MNKNRVPCDELILLALELYRKLMTAVEEDQPSNIKEFKVSNGWLATFKQRANLKCLRLTGESASAEHAAARACPETFEKIIEENGYLPEQVFNADKMGLFWKKCQIEHIFQEMRQAAGHKAAKDRVTIIFCANAAGYLIKTGIIYRAVNPRNLNGKNKNMLPVYYQSNKKAWITAVLFMDWFQKCFVSEMKKYLERKGIEFKVLLVVDNAPGHPDGLQLINKDVEVIFLPPNTTSILQPLNQGVIRCFKAIYTRIAFNKMRNLIENDLDTTVTQCYKKFTIAAIKEASDLIQPKSINACWKNFWKQYVADFQGFPTIENKVARELGDDLQPEEIENIIDVPQEIISNEELVELAQSDNELDSDGDEEVDTMPATFDVQKLNEVFQAAKHLNKSISKYDPSMERSLKVTNNIQKD